MSLYTIENFPDNVKVQKIYPMVMKIVIVGEVKTGFMSKQNNTMQDAYDQFLELINDKDANAIIGVKVEVTPIRDNSGLLKEVIMYGTPALIIEK